MRLFSKLETDQRPPAFNYQNSSHITLINQAVSRFKETLSTLQRLDMALVFSMGMAVSCWVISLNIFAMILTGIATHLGHKRTECFEKYAKDFKELKDVYNWAMEKGSSDMRDKLAMQEIQTLIMTIGPWMPPASICTWEDKDLQVSGIFFSGSRSDLPPDFKQKLAEFASGAQTKNWLYELYNEDGAKNLFNSLRENLTGPATSITQVFK